MRESWNRMESIPIKTFISEKALKRAINDWAEGNRYLKNLLWACYENGIETSGCHSGHGRGTPYVDFRIDTTPREKIKPLVSAALSIGNGQVFAMFNGNPRSGPDWHRPTICMSPFKINDSKRFLKELCKAAKADEDVKDEAIENFMNICEFMEDKETPLLFRIIVEDGKKYTIYAECIMNNRDWDYYDRLFTKASMSYDTNQSDAKWRSDWMVTVNGKEEFAVAIKKLYEAIKNNWTLKLPEEITSDMNDRCKALLMRRKFGTNRAGIEKLNEWLNANKEDRMWDVNY